MAVLIFYSSGIAKPFDPFGCAPFDRLRAGSAQDRQGHTMLYGKFQLDNIIELTKSGAVDPGWAPWRLPGKEVFDAQK